MKKIKIKDLDLEKFSTKGPIFVTGNRIKDTSAPLNYSQIFCKEGSKEGVFYSNQRFHMILGSKNKTHDNSI